MLHVDESWEVFMTEVIYWSQQHEENWYKTKVENEIVFSRCTGFFSFLENFRSYFRPCLTKLTKLRLSFCPGSPIWPIISTPLKSLGWKYSGFSSSNLGLPSPNDSWEIPGFTFLPTASKGGQTAICYRICDLHSYRCFIYSAFNMPFEPSFDQPYKFLSILFLCLIITASQSFRNLLQVLNSQLAEATLYLHLDILNSNEPCAVIFCNGGGMVSVSLYLFGRGNPHHHKGMIT